MVAGGKRSSRWTDAATCWRSPFSAEVAVVKAWKADTSGNLVYRRAGRNFQSLMAMAAIYGSPRSEEWWRLGSLTRTRS